MYGFNRVVLCDPYTTWILIWTILKLCFVFYEHLFAFVCISITCTLWFDAFFCVCVSKHRITWILILSALMLCLVFFELFLHFLLHALFMAWSFYLCFLNIALAESLFLLLWSYVLCFWTFVNILLHVFSMVWSLHLCLLYIASACNTTRSLMD